MKKKKSRLILWILIAALAIGAVVVLPRMFVPADEQSTVQGTTCSVTRGDISATITGNGRLETADTLEIDLPVGVNVETVFVETGDMAHAGDVLATLDASSLETRAAELSAELSALDAQLSARKTVSEIKSPAKGRIKYQPVAEEDDVIAAVNEYGCLAILSIDGLMQLDIRTESQLSLNAEVSVKWNGGSADGTVAAQIDGGYRITLEDEDAPYLGQADVYYNAAKIGSGALEIHAPLAIFGNGGTISEVHCDVDDDVALNAKLFTLSNEPAVDSYRQILSSRNEKAEQLQNVLQYLADPAVLAPEDGVVMSVGLTEGKKTFSTDGSADMTAFCMGVGGAVKMTVDVDELDISKLEVGQTATVTLDAFTGESFSATVTRISRIGTPSGSITTYATELCLEGDERLLSGMNGSAVILSETAEDVLIVPLAGVYEDAQGPYVQKLGSDGTQNKTYIETGLSDGTNVQVLRGLSEGDEIICQTSMSSFEKMQQMMLESHAMFGGEG